MPNYCYGMMMVRGRADNVEEFISILNSDYSTVDGKPKLHFYRVFEVDIDDDYKHDACREVVLRFTCAWSAYCCLEDGPLSYFTANGDYNNINGGTCLAIETWRLNLAVEIFTEEPGIGFTEYIKYINGNCIRSEDHEMIIHQFSNYSSMEDFIAQTGIQIDPDIWDPEGWYFEKNTDPERFTIASDQCNMMISQQMIKHV